MDKAEKPLRAVLFDLDGTLLDLEVDEFMPPYIEALTESLSSYVPAPVLQRALFAGINAMLSEGDGAASNEERFWAAFERESGVPYLEIAGPVARFYAEVFPRLGYVATRVPIAAEVVTSVRSKVERVVLATNAIFPIKAIEVRLEWAGLDPSLFDFVTTYEVMHAAKPHARYYAEICEKLGVHPAEALMIGNDPEQDIAAASQAGLFTYLVDELDGKPGQLREITIRDEAPNGRGPLAAVPAFVDLLQRRRGFMEGNSLD